MREEPLRGPKTMYRDAEPNAYADAEERVARVREAEETKRALNKEREETKRTKIKARHQWWAQHGGAALAVFVGSTIVAIFAGLFIYKEARHRTSSETCEESSEIVSSSDSRFVCSGGGRLEITPVPDTFSSRFRMTCRCNPKPVSSQ